MWLHTEFSSEIETFKGAQKYLKGRGIGHPKSPSCFPASLGRLKDKQSHPHSAWGCSSPAGGHCKIESKYMILASHSTTQRGADIMWSKDKLHKGLHIFWHFKRWWTWQVTIIRQVYWWWSNQAGITLTNAKEYFSTAPSAQIHSAILRRNKNNLKWHSKKYF